MHCNDQIDSLNNKYAFKIHFINTKIGGGAAGGRPAPLYWYIFDVCCMHFEYFYLYVDYFNFDLIYLICYLTSLIDSLII